MNEEYPVCQGPFGQARVEYPVNFDLRIIYTLAEAPALSVDLEKMLTRIGIPFTLIQGVAKPGGRYGRMGARVFVESKEKMDILYAETAKLPGVKTVI